VSNEDWLGAHWEKFKTGLLKLPLNEIQWGADLLNIAYSPGGDDAKTRAVNAWTTTMNFGQSQLGYAGQVASPVLDFPGIKQAGAGLAWVNKTLVNRPFSALGLATSESSPVFNPLGIPSIPTDLGTFFSADTWSKAWNDSAKVTAGQSLTYSAQVALGNVQPGDPNYDPRKNLSAYYDDWMFKTTSGGIDFFATLADPTRGVGKLARLANARYLEGAVTPARVAKGVLEQQTFGKTATVGQSFQEAGGQLTPRAEGLFQQFRILPESVAQRLYFNQYAHGGIVGTGLSAAAKAGDRSTFSDILLSARGSQAATQRIVNSAKNGQSGAAWAEALGRYRNPYGIANVTMRQVDDPFAETVADAQRTTARDAIVDQVALSSPEGTAEYGTLAGIEGAMVRSGVAAGIPKARPKVDAFRIGVHNFGATSYTSSFMPLQVVPARERVIATGAGIGTLVQNAVRIVSPSRGYAAHLMVNEAASYRQFRTNLERAGHYMDDETRNTYVTGYMAALDAEERARIAGHADNFVIGKIADAYQIPVADAERLIQQATMRRGTFRRMLNTQKKFLPHVFKKRADDLMKAGSREEAIRLQEYADRYEALVRSGQAPGYYAESVDDMGNPVFIMDDDWQNPYTINRYDRVAAAPRLDVAKPLLTSQEADRLPMMDYQMFDRGLRRFAKPRLTIEQYRSDMARAEQGLARKYPKVTKQQYTRALADRAMSAGRGLVEDMYDVFNSVWSVAAVLRPAQTLRQLGDDGTRVLTMMGVTSALLSGMQGAARIGYNLTRDGYTWAQEHGLIRAQRAIEGRSHHEIRVADVGDPLSVHATPSESAGYYNYIDPATAGPIITGDHVGYQTLEDAVVNGHISLATYIETIPYMARQGRVPWQLEAAYEEWAGNIMPNGQRGRNRFTREVVEYLNEATGQFTFTSPRWQSDAMDAINSTLYRARYRENHGIVLDPMGDDAEVVLDRAANKDYEFTDHRYLHTDPETGQLEDPDAIYDFAADHAGKLASGYKLHAKITSDSRVRLSIVRQRDMPRTIAERMSARDKQLVIKGLKARGSAGVRLVDGSRTVTIPGVFSYMDGDYIRSAASASYIPHAFIKGQRMADRAAMWSNRVGREDIHPNIDDPAGKPMPNKDWAPAWNRSVNAQLANDQAARLLLQGKSEAQVLDWLESPDPQALRYWNSRPKLATTIDQHVSTVRALVDFLVPPEAGQALRDKVLNHEADAAELRRAVPERLLPSVNGQVTETSLGTHPVIQWAKKGIDWWFRNLQDKPADFLVRYPFIDHRYRGYFETAYDIYRKQTPGPLVRQEEIDRIGRMARQKALDDTKRYLYDQSFRTDLANFLTPIMPFSNAIADAVFKWAKIAYERPLDTLANWNLIYNFPERAGIVYDQDGNSLHYEDGKEVWRSKLDGSIMPDKVKDENGKLVDAVHDKYVAFQPPSWLANKIPGGLKLLTFNKNSMTSAIFDPSVNVGPLIALPVNHFALYHPEVGENQFVKTYVLPFGPTSDEAKSILPGMLRSAYTFFREDESKASSAAMAIYQTQLTDALLGKRNTPPNLEEAKQQARHEEALRFFTSVTSPVSFQYNTPYKPYIDLYSQLLRKYSGDDAKAMEEFRATAGDQYLYLAARVTKSNIALPATLEGYRSYKAKQDAVQKYPDLAGLITGDDGAGSFAKSVYEWEKLQTYDDSGKPIREDMTIADSIRDLQRRQGWDAWAKYNAQLENDLARRGLHSINAQGAEDLKQAYEYWITVNRLTPSLEGNEVELSPWYLDFKSTDGAKMESRLIEMQQLLSDHPEWLRGRDDLQGLAQYLDMRRDLKTRMDSLGFATLDSQKASWLQDAWEAQLSDLRSRNNAFGQLYARWLSRDNLSAQGLFADQVISTLEAAYGTSNSLYGEQKQ